MASAHQSSKSDGEDINPASFRISLLCVLIAPSASLYPTTHRGHEIPLFLQSFDKDLLNSYSESCAGLGMGNTLGKKMATLLALTEVAF